MKVFNEIKLIIKNTWELNRCIAWTHLTIDIEKRTWDGFQLEGRPKGTNNLVFIYNQICWIIK